MLTKSIGAFASGSLLYLLTKQFHSLSYKAHSKGNHINDYTISLSNTLPFSPTAIDKFKSSFVVVVGIGGVGSHVIHCLIKSGLNHIRVIDYDLITLSSLNRHAFATLRDVGQLKSRIVLDYAKTINPNVVIEPIDDAFNIKDAERYISKGNPNYVIDCIDDLNTKCDLIHYCHSNGIPIISSMGAAGKCNPSMVRHSMFNDINGDVLAKRMRFLYKKKYTDALPNIPSVLSIEKVAKGLSDLEEHQKGKNKVELKQFYINPKERIRTLPVFACLPAAFGQCLASVVINALCGNDILNKDNSNEDKEKCLIGNTSLTKLVKDHRIHETVHRETKEEDFYLVFDDYYRIAKAFNFVSSISNKPGNKMRFIRWRSHNKPTIDNIVIMNKGELFNHNTIKNEEELNEYYGKELVKVIDEKLSALSSTNTD